jgi:hypothetical protein
VSLYYLYLFFSIVSVISVRIESRGNELSLNLFPTRPLTPCPFRRRSPARAQPLPQIHRLPSVDGSPRAPSPAAVSPSRRGLEPLPAHGPLLPLTPPSFCLSPNSPSPLGHGRSRRQAALLRRPPGALGRAGPRQVSLDPRSLLPLPRGVGRRRLTAPTFLFVLLQISTSGAAAPTTTRCTLSAASDNSGSREVLLQWSQKKHMRLCAAAATT